ncbi:MAG: ExbD/TolR family protein [Bradymonadia bacterium]
MAGGNLGGGGDDEGIVGINVTPLVDIMLVLLIIFMVTATYIVKPAIEVDLPSAASGGETVDTTISIVVGKNGELFLDGEPVDEAAIAERCREKSKKNPQIQAIVAADSKSLHGGVIRIIDIIRLNGVTKFAFNINPAAVSDIRPVDDPNLPAPPPTEGGETGYEDPGAPPPVDAPEAPGGAAPEPSPEANP